MAIRSLAGGELSAEERRFEAFRVDEAEMAAAIKAGNLLPYIQVRNAQIEARAREQKGFTLLNFQRWEHAVNFERVVRSRLSGTQAEESLRAFNQKALQLLQEKKGLREMRSVLYTSGNYYGNAHSEIFWQTLHEWCRKHLAALK